MRLAIVGDTLLDRDLEGDVTRLSPDAPVPVLDELSSHTRPGGAGLAALLAARDGHEVTLVTPLGDDAAALELTALLDEESVAVVALRSAAPTAEKIRIRDSSQPLLRIDRGGKSARSAIGPPGEAAREALLAADAILAADYGRGALCELAVRNLLRERGERPLVWDPHPLGPAPVPGVDLA